MLVVGFENWHCLLHDDRTVIEFFIHKMHRATRNLHTVCERLLLGFQSGERGQQRRMDVENPMRELTHEPRREQPHIAGKANQIDLVTLQSGYDLTVVIIPVSSL